MSLRNKLRQKKSLLSINYKVGDEGMERILTEIFDAVDGMPSDKRRLYREGLVNINYAHQLAATRSMMSHDWKNSGLYFLDIKKIITYCGFD